MSLLRRLLSSLFGVVRRDASLTVQVRHLIRNGRLFEAESRMGASRTRSSLSEVDWNCLRAELEFHRKNDYLAESLFRQVLISDPGMASAHHGLSLVLQARGEVDEAVRHSQFAFNKQSDESAICAQLGLCHLQLGNFVQAERALTRAVALDPENAYAWNNLGIAARGLNDVSRAVKAFGRAMAIDARFVGAQENFAVVTGELHSKSKAIPGSYGFAVNPSDSESEEYLANNQYDNNDTDGLIDDLENFLHRSPDDQETAMRLFSLYREKGDIRAGIDVLKRSLQYNVGSIDLMRELGCALISIQEFKSARLQLEAAHKLSPNDSSILIPLSVVLKEFNELVQSANYVYMAYNINPSLENKRFYADALLNSYRYEEALLLYNEIIADSPEVADELAGLRVFALTYLGRHDEALPILDRAIQESPNEPVRRFPRATIHLMNGRFDLGWEDYAFRHQGSVHHVRTLHLPRWRGEELGGSTILVLAEQGLGDQVMFASCLHDLEALGATRIFVECHRRISKLIARSFPKCTIVPTGQDSDFAWVVGLGVVDFYIHAGDLPARFRRSIDSFPYHSGYIYPDASRVGHWRASVGSAASGRLRVGLSWRGGTDLTRKGLRSIPVHDLVPLLQLDADWVCLQYGDVSADLELITNQGIQVSYDRASIEDLDEFAALIGSLDLVITACNTTVHFAGALGKDVWVMAPTIPEWRYGLHFDRLPWYPSSRIFRQKVSLQWSELVDRVAVELSDLVDLSTKQ